MESNYSLSDVQHKFRTELAGYYPNQEITQIYLMVTEHLLNYSKVDTFLRSGEAISDGIKGKFDQVLHRLKNWEPIQYILGYAWFYGLTLDVDRRVLIPRQETEELVHWIIGSEKGGPYEILDVGTGSGCIAISLAVNMPQIKVSACDISTDALALARNNALKNKADLNFFEFDVTDERGMLPNKYRVIVSNPPYVRQLEKQVMMKNVLDYEPSIALFVPDNDPLLFYKRIALLGRKYLLDGGSLYLEINEHFPHEVVRLLESTGFYGIEVMKDINGKSRMIKAGK